MIKSRLDIAITAFFVLLGLLVAADAIWMQTSFHDDVDCNARVTNLLVDRENARLTVDKSTTEAQEALVSLFDHVLMKPSVAPNDPEVILARQKFFQAALDRQTLARLQSSQLPYC